MSHHSPDDFPDELKKDFFKKVGSGNKAFSKLSEQFGATDNFPEGKLNESDEGETVIGISHHKGKVIMDFGVEPIKWIGFNPTQARQIAITLLSHADEALIINP